MGLSVKHEYVDLAVLADHASVHASSFELLCYEQKIKYSNTIRKPILFGMVVS